MFVTILHLNYLSFSLIQKQSTQKTSHTSNNSLIDRGYQKLEKRTKIVKNLSILRN